MNLTNERETPYRLISDHEFFADDMAEASPPNSLIVAFDHPVHYIEDQEILGLAEEIKKARGQKERRRQMTKYDVYLYPVVRLKVPSVEAHSQKEAIEIALEQFELNGCIVREGEYADELEYFLVDEQGDEEHLNTCSYSYNDDGDIVKTSR